MQPLESQEEREARHLRSKRVISFILLAILVLSSVGYAFIMFESNDDNPSVNTPSDGQLQSSDGRWIIEYSDTAIPFVFSKESVKNITVSSYTDMGSYYNKPVYLVSGNNTDAFRYEMAITLGQFTRLSQACLGPCEDDLPEKNCTDMIIAYNVSNDNSVRQEDNCVFIEGDLRAVDAFLYTLFTQ